MTHLNQQHLDRDPIMGGPAAFPPCVPTWLLPV
jgi:hypothetical protein